MVNMDLFLAYKNVFLKKFFWSLCFIITVLILKHNVLCSFFVLQKLLLVLIWFIYQKPAHIVEWGKAHTQMYKHKNLPNVKGRINEGLWERGEKLLEPETE